jgi:hypothetical protein
MCRHRIAVRIAIGFCLVAGGWAQSLPAPQLPEGPMKAKATTACNECHDSRIIVQQRLSKAAWTKEVDKMTKWGALVDAQDRDALIDYLSNHFGVDKPEYVADRTRRTAETRHAK